MWAPRRTDAVTAAAVPQTPRGGTWPRPDVRNDLRFQIRPDSDGLLSGQQSLQTEQEILQAQRDDIKRILEGHAVTQAMIQRAFDSIHAHLERRFDSLERALNDYLAAR
jgi:hypothetical protein